jgi:hypothetical protein
MDARREAVCRYVENREHIIAEFIEVETGKNLPNVRSYLAGLTEYCGGRAVLLIGRLDRLARNVAFIANLMDSDGEFIAVAMLQANRLLRNIAAVSAFATEAAQ